ncbi:ECF-type riboflavin transporter substrate-binding protein [Brevibacillus humidisoli]|uniref:ECF-type riboflavin transporter substrate-binding protein n=1 Tax=Brevibacillus humidisoli TaxID=2895522 RepID=UPI001E5C040A|nr:ECF-type riboflavin transporter substrate-binding protein [Brevibacillus humidisoli]UFJ39485.1 ECF-type riboflavin transporter substrate-binding protein [Brevibacillus humidisoli]
MSSSKSIFELSTKTVVVIGIGAVLYGLLSYVTNFVPVAGNSLRPAISVLTLIGAMFGPLVGFFVGTFGAMINDLFSGQIWLHWNIGNGIIGIFAGLVFLMKDFDVNRGQVRTKHYLWVVLYGLVGNIVGLTAAALVDVAMGTPFATAVVSWAIVPALVNVVWVATLGLLLIAAFARRKSGHTDLEIGK